MNLALIRPGIATLLTSLFLGGAFVYYTTIQDALSESHSQIEFLRIKLKDYEHAKQEFQSKSGLWEDVKKERLGEETNPSDLQKQIKSLGKMFKFKHLSLSFQEAKPTGEAKGLETHQILLKIKSTSDRDIFMFLNYLRTQSPGLLSIDRLSLERQGVKGSPLVVGEVAISWVHGEEEI